MVIPSVQELSGTFADPSTRHAAMTHAPIVLALLLPILTGIALVTQSRVAIWATLIVGCVGVVSAWLGVLSGESAYAVMGPVPMSVGELAHVHEEMAEKLWLFLCAASLASGAMLLRQAHLRTAGKIVAPLASVGGAVWVIAVAHHGGTLVYSYGVGTPDPLSQRELDATLAGTDPYQGVDSRVIHFRTKVYPYLAENCMGCHSPKDTDAAWLDMTSFDGLSQGGELGPAVLPGNPESSPLFTIIHAQDPIRMPPDGPLPTSAEASAIERWIRNGAVWSPPEE